MREVLEGILDILQDLNGRIVPSELDDEGGNWEPGRRCLDDIEKLKTALAELKAE